MMIRVITADGLTNVLHPDAIARISEAPTSSQWHGIRAYVKLFDGSTIETQESVYEIEGAIQVAIAARSQAKEGGA